MTSVLVTGHLGYVGAVLCPMLEARGYSVVGADTGFFGGVEKQADPRLPPDAPNLDVRHITPANLENIDAIVHLAALSNDPMGELDPELTDAINHRASVRFAELAKQAGVGRFVFSSSCSLYGAADINTPLDETAPFNPVTAYARSKVDSEAAIGALAGSDFTPVFLRNATAYGLSPSMRFDLVVNNLVGWALTTGNVVLQSDGSPWRPLVHVEDIARAFIASLESPQAAVHNQAFNIGRDDQNFQIRDIARAVQEAVPGCAVKLATGAGPDTRSYRVGFAKVVEGLPGFQPRWNLQAGIRQMVDYFRKRGLTEEEFQGRRFVRLEQLRHLLATSQVDSQLLWKNPKA